MTAVARPLNANNVIKTVPAASLPDPTSDAVAKTSNMVRRLF